MKPSRDRSARAPDLARRGAHQCVENISGNRSATSLINSSHRQYRRVALQNRGIYCRHDNRLAVFAALFTQKIGLCFDGATRLYHTSR